MIAYAVSINQWWFFNLLMIFIFLNNWVELLKLDVWYKSSICDNNHWKAGLLNRSYLLLYHRWFIIEWLKWFVVSSMKHVQVVTFSTGWNAIGYSVKFHATAPVQKVTWYTDSILQITHINKQKSGFQN